MRRLWSEKTIDYDGRYYKLDSVGILPHPAQKPGIPIWVVADRSENGFKRVGRLGDGWVTLAPTVESLLPRGERSIDQYAQEHGRAGKCPVSALYATFNINSDGERARREEGWQWMESFFQQPREKISYHFTIFGTPEECARQAERVSRSGPDDDHRAHRIG